ncbi:MAG: phosphatidate cytidylyltransferase [Neisseriaceae bacterium]
MLVHRVMTSLILLFLTYLVFFQISDNAFIAATTIFFAIGVYELVRMYNFSEINKWGVVILFIVLSIYFGYTNLDITQIIRGVCVGLWCFIVPFILISQPKKIHKFIVALLALTVFTTASYALILLREALGVWQLISIMAIAWIADIGAYFVGRKFGRHKLAPHISPGKSIEGTIAGIVLVIVYLLILKYFNLAVYLYNYMAVFKFGFILVIASIVGDLFESWLKRVAMVKDSGAILPGHGGIFDRIDSLIAVLAMSFAMIRGLL